MTKDVCRMGEEERAIVSDWCNTFKVATLREARFIMKVKEALNEVKHEYMVSFDKSVLSKKEYNLYLGYKIATHQLRICDVVEDKLDASFFKIISFNNRLNLVDAKVYVERH